MLNALIERGFGIRREHAYEIYHNAKGGGQLAKTDRLDASMIAYYAECYTLNTRGHKICRASMKFLLVDSQLKHLGMT